VQPHIQCILVAPFGDRKVVVTAKPIHDCS
jgi:hypothetical protein